MKRFAVVMAITSLVATAMAGKPKASAKKVLASLTPGVQECAAHGLGKSPSIGVSVKVKLDAKGHVSSDDVKVTVMAGDPEPIRACVDKLVRAAAFPPGATTVSRDWDIEE